MIIVENGGIDMVKKTEQVLADWEKKFVKALKDIGSENAKFIYNELKRLIDETSQTANIEETEAEEIKQKHTEELKNLEQKLDELPENNEITKLQASLRELDKKLKEKKEIIKETPNNQIQSEIKQLEIEHKELKKEMYPYSEIIGGLTRKLRTVTNRVERSVFSGFGSMIRNRREELGLSLKQIEEETGISPSYINRIEKGVRKAPSFRIIEQLAKALDMPVNKLINVAESPAQKTVSSLEELLLTSQFTVNGKRASKQSKEKMVEFIKKLSEADWSGEKKYEESIKLMGFFDYFKETFSSKKK